MAIARSNSPGEYIKFDILLTEREYEKLKKVSRLNNMTMADLIRDALNEKYIALENEEIRRKWKDA